MSAIKSVVAATLLGLTLSTAQAVPIHGMGTWDSTLQPRDLDGDGAADAFFDTERNITWLRDANLNGLMNWTAATAWAANLNIGGHSGWRLPSSFNLDGKTLCGTSHCFESEMGHLFYQVLGNHFPTLNIINDGNTGDFLNNQLGGYWTSTELPGQPGIYFDFGSSGWQAYEYGYNRMFAMAVHDGDLAVHVPEPGALLLVFVGLLGLASIARRKKAPL